MTTKQNTDSYRYTTTTEGRNCYTFDFSVAASNRAGTSAAVVTHTGHPIGICMTTLVLSCMLYKKNHDFLAPDEVKEVEISPVVSSSVNISFLVRFHVGTYYAIYIAASGMCIQ